MKSKRLFWILTVLVFGSLATAGIIFFKTDPALLWTAEGITILALVLFIVLYRRLVRPYRILLDGIGLLHEQDFSSRLRPVANREANQLIEVFNRMITELKNERLQVREKNRFLDLLIQASPQGVIILDFDDKISEINPAGQRLLQIKDTEQIKGLRIAESGIRMATELGTMQPGEDRIIRIPGQAIFRCIRSSFIDNGFDHPFILVEELTRELMRIEKESYERIIRMMSHEVNNSVGAIGATLNVLSDILEQDDRQEALPAVKASAERCTNLARFTCKLADLVRIPKPVLTHIPLNELLRSAAALTRSECAEREIELILEPCSPEVDIYVDGIQMEQVLVNIVKNAYEAIDRNGRIRITGEADPPSIQIENNGPDIPDEIRGKLFTPFFTTKPSGQGIGLMFVREVLNNHRLPFSLTSQNGSTQFRILFCPDKKDL